MSLPNMSCTSYSHRNGRKLSSNTLEELEFEEPAVLKHLHFHYRSRYRPVMKSMFFCTHKNIQITVR